MADRRGFPDPPVEIARSGAPIVDTLDVDVCDVCGAADSDEFATGYDYELITCTNRWKFTKCRACGHVWLNPRPSVDALDVIYPSTYYAYNYAELSKLARRGKEILDGQKLNKILKLCGGTPSRYLDVGCGDGRYLEVMAKRGVPRDQLYGLELDQKSVDDLVERGFQAYCDRVETTEKIPEGSFDLITMFHVIEHVASPRETIERLASWLAPGGLLALETPNLSSLDARLFQDGRWGGYHIPRHWHLFTPETVTRLVESTGLHVEDVRYETGHAFWMYSMHHVLRYGSKPRPRLARMFDPLTSVVPLVAVTGFDRARAMVGARTSAMLILARR